MAGAHALDVEHAHSIGACALPQSGALKAPPLVAANMEADSRETTMIELYIANKNYSSWSMRPWVLLRQAGIDFEEPFRLHP